MAHDEAGMDPRAGSGTRGDSSRWLVWLLVLPLVGGVLGLMAGAATAYLSPKKYESVALVQVIPTSPGADPFGGASVRTPEIATRQFFATQFAVISSRATLERIVEKLGLTMRWNLPADEVVDVLAGIVTVQQVRDTDLIEIRVRHTQPEDARDIADMVAREYASRRSEMEMERAQDVLSALDAELEIQENKVEEKRKALDTIIKTLGIPPNVSGAVDEFGRSQDEINGMAERQRYEAVREREQLHTQIKSLLRFKGENLWRYAAGLKLPQNGASVLYHEYRADLRNMNSLAAGGMGDAHPEMVAQSARVDVAEKELEREVVAIRKLLESQLMTVEKHQEKLKMAAPSPDSKPPVKEIVPPAYASAKRDYDAARELQQSQKLTQSSRRIQLRIPRSPVTIHERPRTGKAPVSPNVPLCLGGGAVGGAVLGFLLAILLGFVGVLRRNPA